MIVGAALGALAGGVITYNVAKENGAEGLELAGWTVLGALGGGAVGAAGGAAIGTVLTKITGVLGFSIVNGKIFTVTETMVIGNTGYIALAEALGYGYFSVSPNLSSTQIWDRNVQFLYDCSKLGANFIVEPNRVIAQPGTEFGSWLYKEIQYLLEQGYQWLEDLSALVR